VKRFELFSEKSATDFVFIQRLTGCHILFHPRAEADNLGNGALAAALHTGEDVDFIQRQRYVLYGT
jgi:hypothetical protein